MLGTGEGPSSHSQSAINKASQAKARSDTAFSKAMAASLQVVGMGSGKVPLLLPAEK